MTAPRRKKLIEVALPLKAINEASAREKSIRHGHPSTLHLWWARRPLAACRAVLFSSLVDDPDSDPVYRRADGTVDEDAAGIKRAELFNLIEELVQWENSNNPEIIRSARAEIARCVASRKLDLGEFTANQKLPIDWAKVKDNEAPTPNSPPPKVKDFIRACRCKPVFLGTQKSKKKSDRRRFGFEVDHLPPAAVVNQFLVEHAPPVLDPFAGGGSIPLEAQRLGLRAHASDLNPVAVLINKALIEIPPKFAGLPPVNPAARKDKKLTQREWRGAEGLAEDVRYYGQWMRDEAEKRIGHLYPKVKVTKQMAKDRPDLEEYVREELTVIAWLWARTVRSPNPAYSTVDVPLTSSFWLSKKRGREAWVAPIINQKGMGYTFEVKVGQPSQSVRHSADSGTKLARGCRFRCLMSDAPISEEYVKAAGMAGQIGHRLMAVVCSTPRGRVYISPTPRLAQAAHIEIPKEIEEISAPLANDPRNLWCLRYGLDTFEKLFSARQLTTLVTLSTLVGKARVFAESHAARVWSGSSTHSPNHYAEAIATYLACGISKIVDYNCALVTWIHQRDQAGHALTKQAIPMVWDFTEVNPLVGAAGDITISLKSISRGIENAVAGGVGQAQQLSAVDFPRDCTGAVIATDPPYYDNIAYADLSDFFYVWLRRSLQDCYPELMGTVLTPKSDELIASPYRHNGSKSRAASFFEDGLGRAIEQWREWGNVDYPSTLFYAFKQAETDSSGTASTGWETFLTGVIAHGFTITATWPMRTERETRSVAMGTNALASSVVLACVHREAHAPMATRRDFLNSLKHELPTALNQLQSGSVAPVDLAQAAIGPGMAVFSRYSKVMEADGSPMKVRQALALINQSLDEVLAEQEGEFDADTRWAIAWFSEYGMDEGPFGTAETLSKAKNTAVGGLVEAGLIHARGGKVRLLKRNELSADWDPATDTRLRHWEVVQHLIRTLETAGEAAAAGLLRRLGGAGEVARDLAYRLYNICERQKWAQEALAYNGLVTAWPEITKLALELRSRQASPVQQTLNMED